MTEKERSKYEPTDSLRRVFEALKGQKFRLDCGHHVTFGHFLGNDLTILNGKNPTIICSQCGH